MNNPVLFAFLTGFHLALLQFSYFFFLMINITSTYVTYAAVVLSWMMGTLVGLLLKGLSGKWMLIMGVASYYTIYALVASNPLSSETLPLACLGVAITGLWAGRFFIQMRPFFDRIDRLFLHENNGFLVGIIGVFVGFTLLGQKFLIWGPLLTGVVLLAYFEWLAKHFDDFKDKQQAKADHLHSGLVAVIATKASGSIQGFMITMIIVNLLLPLGIIMQAAITGEDYWRLFEGERNAITWFSSIQLVVIGIVAYFNHEVAALSHKMGLSKTGRYYWVWIIFTLGFVFLALDERFEIHQTIREEWLVPAQLFTSIPYLREGDVILYFYLAIGLVFTVILVKELRRRFLSLVLFAIALIVIAASAVMDSLLLEITRSWPFPNFWTSAFEEVGEIWSQLLFMLSFLFILQSRLGELSQVQDTLSE